MSAHDRVAWREVLDHVAAAHAAGYEMGYAHGRNDLAEDEQRAAVHDLACRTIGLRPLAFDDDDAPLWSVAV